jgi:hypothetical protein
LSVLIPARNEEWLKQTIDDALANSTADTEVIAVLDGAWAEPPIPDHPRVTLVYHSTPVGQRAAVNEAARFSKAKYIMKADAHCAFGKGFDTQLMHDYEDGQTVIPRMYNLHVFDHVCQTCGDRQYQGLKPAKCEKCGGQYERETVWQPRMNRRTDYARFDTDLHFQYWNSYEKRGELKAKPIDDVMCFVGACFFMSRARYWELDGLDEGHGSWGQMGVEISCKSWLSGGCMVVNKNTWFSHLFRTQPGFGFPYPMRGSDQDRARDYSREMWRWKDVEQMPKWDKAVRPLRWLLDKFAPVPGWHA